MRIAPDLWRRVLYGTQKILVAKNILYPGVLHPRYEPLINLRANPGANPDMRR